MNEFFIFTVIYIIVGVALIFGGVAHYKRREQFIERGVRVTATVTDVSTRQVTRNKKRVTQYDCVIEYMADSNRITNKHTSYNPCSPGDTIDIAYLPEAPKKFMTADNLTNSLFNKVMPFVLITIGVVLLILGVVFMVL